MRVSRLRFGLFVLAAAVVAASIAPALADPRGVWLAKDGAKVRVSKCGANMCGTLIAVNPARDPVTKRPRRDVKNPDPKLAKRPLVGIMVFQKMQPNGRGRWSGKLYDPDRGITVDGHLIEKSKQVLRVEGCVGAMCGGEDLNRSR